MSTNCAANENQEKLNNRTQKECTDIFCLIVFVIFIIIMIFVASFAFVYGNPQRLLNGYDSFGNICGAQNEKIGDLKNTGLDMTDKRYLFFFNVKDVFNSLKICVKKCPHLEMQSPIDVYNFAKQTGSFLCRYDILLEQYKLPDPLNNHSSIHVWNHVCPVLPIYRSSAVLRRCIPKSTELVEAKMINNVHSYLNNIDIIQLIFNNFYTSWKTLLSLVFVAFGLSYMMCLIFRRNWFKTPAAIVVFLMISCFVITGILWWVFAESKQILDNTPYVELLEESILNEDAFLVYAIIATIVTIGFILVVLNIRSHFTSIVTWIYCANECLQDLHHLYFQPVFTFFTLCMLFMLWIYIMLYLSTANHQSSNYLSSIIFKNKDHVEEFYGSSSKGKKLNFTVKELLEIISIQYTDHSWVHYTWWCCIFYVIWCSEFILACQQMVIAGTIAQWYFRRKFSGTVKSPIYTTTRRSLLFHVGSLALGSCLITIFKLPRLFIKSLMNRWNKSQLLRENRTCCPCYDECKCSWCKKIMDFIYQINHNAYIVVVMANKPFFKSAKIVYRIEQTSPSNSLHINGVVDCFLFFCKCLVTCIVALIGLLIMKADPRLHFYAIPLFALCISSFFIAHCVISLYEMIIDTLFICYYQEKKECSINEEDICCASKLLQDFMLKLSEEETNIKETAA